jgi:hypothetical protein
MGEYVNNSRQGFPYMGNDGDNCKQYFPYMRNIVSRFFNIFLRHTIKFIIIIIQFSVIKISGKDIFFETKNIFP